MLRTEEITTTIMKMRVWEKSSTFSSSKFEEKEIVVPGGMFAQSNSVNLVDLSTVSRFLLDSETLRSLADHLDSMPEYVKETNTKKAQKATKTFSLGH